MEVGEIISASILITISSAIIGAVLGKCTAGVRDYIRHLKLPLERIVEYENFTFTVQARDDKYSPFFDIGRDGVKDIRTRFYTYNEALKALEDYKYKQKAHVVKAYHDPSKKLVQEYLTAVKEQDEEKIDLLAGELAKKGYFDL